MHVCLFDIDGTLLSTGGAGQAAMEAALRAEFAVTKPVEGIATAGRTDRGIVGDLFAYYEITPKPETWRRFLRAYLDHLPSYLARYPGTTLPGIPELLETLNRRDDVLLGLLTGNYREGARIKLTHFQLDHHFRFGGFGDRHADRNHVAHESLAELRQHYDGEVNPDRIWVIGDTPADVRCARAISARAVAVATGVYNREELAAAKPDELLGDFSQPEPLLQRLQ